MIVRPHRSEDYEAARYIYTEAFRRPENPDSVPREVPLFEALWKAGDAIPEFSLTAVTDGGVVGHVTASRATVANDPVVAVGPIGVLPDHQGTGIGSALMDALLERMELSVREAPRRVLDAGGRIERGKLGELRITAPERLTGDPLTERVAWTEVAQAAEVLSYAPRVVLDALADLEEDTSKQPRPLVERLPDAQVAIGGV